MFGAKGLGLAGFCCFGLVLFLGGVAERAQFGGCES